MSCRGRIHAGAVVGKKFGRNWHIPINEVNRLQVDLTENVPLVEYISSHSHLSESGVRWYLYKRKHPFKTVRKRGDRLVINKTEANQFIAQRAKRTMSSQPAPYLVAELT